MKQIEAIRNNPKYVEHYHRLQTLEENRVFCRHDMTHFLDVARIAHIQNLEQGLGIRKEVIYAAALLHDIGKDRQYIDGTPHEIASAETAGEIMRELPEGLAFSEMEKAMILDAIRLHRRKSKGRKPLAELLYKSDKMSRNCFACGAEKQCNWSTIQKNMEITI
ncbi:MAG: HD domain-containing protein [Hespellia sp.]|nr:HD domain-containing protein [Hespellia sp.]